MDRNGLGADDDPGGGHHGQGEPVVPGLPGVDEQQDDGARAQCRHRGGTPSGDDAQEHDGSHGGRTQHGSRGTHQDHESSQQDRSKQCPPPPGQHPEGCQAQTQDNGDMLPGDGRQMGHGDGAHVLAHLLRQGVVVPQGDTGYEGPGARWPETRFLPHSCGALCPDGLGKTSANAGDGPEHSGRWAEDLEISAFGDDGCLGAAWIGGSQARAYLDVGPHGQVQPLLVGQDGGAQVRSTPIHLLDVEGGDDEGGPVGGGHPWLLGDGADEGDRLPGSHRRGQRVTLAGPQVGGADGQDRCDAQGAHEQAGAEGSDGPGVLLRGSGAQVGPVTRWPEAQDGHDECRSQGGASGGHEESLPPCRRSATSDGPPGTGPAGDRRGEQTQVEGLGGLGGGRVRMSPAASVPVLAQALTERGVVPRGPGVGDSGGGTHTEACSRRASSLA